jgi:hypothetical protein
MDLQHAPLLRLQVARTEQGDWLVLMQLHHLVSDHVALEVVVEEVGAYMEGRASQLDEPQPYREYVAHVLHWARHSDAQRFFSERLSSIEEPSAPFGLVQGTGDDFPIEEVHELLDEQLADRLRTQARQLRMSSASLFHAAWALVVAATSARNTVVFGTVLSGRLQGAAGADRALGMFINTLPLCVTLSGQTASELIQQVHSELLELVKYEPASLTLAQRCSGVDPRAPLFTALLNYRHSPHAKVAPLSALSRIAVLGRRERTNYPLTVSVDDLDEAFGLSVQADQRIQARRVLCYLQTALQSLVEALEHDPGRAALDIQVLPTEEHRTLIDEFNATAMEFTSCSRSRCAGRRRRWRWCTSRSG